MKLWIRGNAIRLTVSKTELAKLADQGAVEDAVRFTSEIALEYRIDVRPTGAVTAAFDGAALRVALPKALLDLWLRPDQPSVEGSQPIGGGKVLQIVLEKDGAERGRQPGGGATPPS